MFDLMRSVGGAPDSVVTIVVRLIVAMVMGAVVALVYRRTTGVPGGSFTNTLVLLAILIAMVTQVIGDNVARAFSLVGALSIVRFRTVVRDTQDTAYVIGAVAVGMAVGAGQFWVAAAGIAVVAVAAFAMRRPVAAVGTGDDQVLPFELSLRVTLGFDLTTTVRPVLEQFTNAWRLAGAATAKQGGALDVSYQVDLKDAGEAHLLVGSLNKLSGVQSVGVTLVDRAVPQ